MSPTWTLLCRTGETSPPSSFLVVKLRLVPASPDSEYWRTWRSPSGSWTLTLTYWPGEGRGDGGVVGRFQGEGHGAGAGGGLGGDPPRAPHRAVGLCGVEALLELDQRIRHEPVDLGPGFGDFRGDDLGQVLGDGGEEVLVDHLVLRFGDAEGSVAVGDAGEHGLRQGAGVVHQVGGESGDAPGQGLLLVAVALVGAAEETVQQFRVRGEEPGVELGGDFTDPGTDQRQGGLDDGEGFVREHCGLLR